MLNVDPKKACGPDEIPNNFLRRYAEWCSRYLGLIFRKSISSSKLPDDWKKAKVAPIPKTANSEDPSDFRPISLTSTSCKLLEHIILKHITLFLETKGTLSPYQHGFRKGLSTTTQLTEVVHDLAFSINNRSQTDLILLDFSKAFDSVCHKKLTAKLKSILGTGNLTNWIEDFLYDRSQFVIFENVQSDSMPVTSGVPQGSVLGPLLFLIYTGSFSEHCQKFLKIGSSRKKETLFRRRLLAAADAS